MNKTFEEFLRHQYMCWSQINSHYVPVTFDRWFRRLDYQALSDYANLWSKESAPIDPAVARKSLDCIQKMREALEKSKKLIEHEDTLFTAQGREEAIETLTNINEALQETQRKG